MTSKNRFGNVDYFQYWLNSLKTYSASAYRLDSTTLRNIYTDLGEQKVKAQIDSIIAKNPNVTSKERLYEIIGQSWTNNVEIDTSLQRQQKDYAERFPGKTLPTTFNDYYSPQSGGAPPAATMSNFERRARENAGLVNSYNAPGTNVPGMGTINAQGQLSRGVVENIGGGKINTVVQQDERGDYIAQGPQSVEVAQQTLRPKFVVAGGEEVRPTVQEDGQSNALFESFSIVPDGYGLGPDNRLHLLNKQNDVIRYGIEKMYEPRVDAPITPAHAIPPQWKESMTLAELEEAYATKIGLELLKARGVSIAQSNPMNVLEDDYNLIPSSKGLARQTRGPSPFYPTVFNLEDFLPSRDPPGLQMNSLQRADSLRGTLGYRRKRVFDSLIR